MKDGIPPSPAPFRKGAGRPTKEEAEARYDELIDTALDVFLERGFELATIEMIALRMNMTKRTIYAKFTDKASLFKTAVERAVERQIIPQAVLDGLVSEDLAATLEAIALHRIRQMMAPNGLRLQRIINTESYRFPEFFDWNFEHSARPLMLFVEHLFERAIGEGAIAPTDVNMAAMGFMGLVISSPVRMIVAGRPMEAAALERQVKYSVALLLDGLRPR